MIVIVLAALCTYLVPAGKFDTINYQSGNTFTYTSSSGDTSLGFTQRTLDSLKLLIPLEKFASGSIRKPVSVPGTYKVLPSQKQGLIDILKAPVKGIYDSIDIIFFILVIGGFMKVFDESAAMTRGIATLSYRMNGKESWLIIILTFLFSFAGASYGMAEEALVFYAVLVPIFLTAGYDLIVPVAVIFGGTQLGTLSSFSNPFSTIIASNAAGISWTEGITERLIMFILTTVITIVYIIRYANKVKRDPSRSLVFRTDGIKNDSAVLFKSTDKPAPLGTKTSLLLFLFLATFLMMIGGVIWLEWWLPEMTVLFIASSILVALILRMNEKVFMQRFISGCEGLLSVALIVGVARGVGLVLSNGNISDSIVFHAANLVQSMPPSLFILMMMLLFVFFTLFISSSSGMAVLTMPIMGSLAMLVHVPGREIVNAYLFGMGIMGFITPTGLILPSLALVNVSIKAWWRFIWPLMLILLIVCGTCLLVGIQMK